MPKIALAIVAVGALAVGAAAGAIGEHLRLRTALQFEALGEMCRIGAFSGYVEGQKRYGTPEAYERALKDLLHDLEDRNKSSTGFVPRDMRLFDEALAYARLSDVQALRGATEDSAESLRKAESLCPAVKWRDCSGKKILEFVRHLDSRMDAHWEQTGEEHGS